MANPVAEVFANRVYAGDLDIKKVPVKYRDEVKELVALLEETGGELDEEE